MSRLRRGHPPAGPVLEHRTSLRVRFNEVDSLGIAWHGHYLAWFEVGREAFGEAYGLAYSDFIQARVVAPMVHVCADYVQPARHGELLQITTRLHGNRAARIELSYEVRRETKGGEGEFLLPGRVDDTLLARGHTTQAFVTPDGDLLLNLPSLMRDFYARHLPELTLSA